MGFFLYLSPQGQQILNQLISAKTNIKENYGLCRNHDVFGYTDKPNLFVICTKNIKTGGYDPYRYVNETVYHEAVHAAQNCKKTDLLGIPVSKMPLSLNKLRDIQNSMKATHNYSAELREHEAFYLEDKPTQVRYYVQRFCF